MAVNCWDSMVDGSEMLRSPVEVGSLSHYLRGFVYPGWCRISEPSSVGLLVIFLVGKSSSSSSSSSVQTFVATNFQRLTGRCTFDGLSTLIKHQIRTHLVQKGRKDGN